MQQLPEPWKSFFNDLDRYLNQEVTLHCLGGFAAKIMYDLPRETSDVDVLPFGSNRDIENVLGRAREGSELHKRYHVYLQVVGLASIPEGYEARLTEMFPGMFKHLRLFALIHTIWPSQKSNATVNVIEMM